jgi:DNA-binding SARP family transcriptional activator/tetratricopeptide (TPR) repeat protein
VIDGDGMAGDAGLRIGVLGPLLGTRDGAAVRLPGGRAAVLLAVLAMSGGRPVSSGRLTELIWSDELPKQVRASLHTLVARLRGVVPGVVIRTGDAYLLDIDPDNVDLLRFRRLVREADEAGDPTVALGLLDRALGLWRGEPLSDLRSAVLAREVIPGLADEHLSAIQQRIGLDLAAGRHDRVVAELRGLSLRYPLRESLWGMLLRALASAGRPAEAISEYHRARGILAAELGVDPSPDLQDLYQQLLQGGQHAAAGQPPSAPGLPVGRSAGNGAAPDEEPAGGVRHRLPADTRLFTGRQAELEFLLGLAEAADGERSPGTVVISAIDGMAGIGKTALAVHAAHRLAERFCDGQLFIDLHGYTRDYRPRTASQALETLLRTLGVPPQQIPEDAEERAALYRERLAGTRTLIVLDNAADEAQVRPLIPGEAGCMVLITSRRKLRALDDAHAVALDVLPEADAITLFCTMAGPGRAALVDPAVAGIVGRCGRLPLAVRIVAALLRSRPAWGPAHLTDKLHAAHTALDVLIDGDRDLAAVFDLSTQTLHDDQRRLYSYLGLVPGPEADAHAMAALLNADPATAERLLQELVDRNLLLEPTAGRYRMHDLIRAHARTLAAPDPAGEAALGRLLDYYQDTARRADARIARYPRPAPIGPPPARVPALPDADTARAWLRAERGNLTACLQHAMQRCDDDRTVALGAGLANLLRTDGPWPQAIAAQAAAAARLSDQFGQARALTELGDLRRLTGDYPGADRNLRAALELWREAGDKSGQARALLELGIVGFISGGYREAEPNLRAALELWREAGDKSGQARALTQIAEVQLLTGSYEGAIQNGEAALAVCKEIGDRLGQANALSVLGKLLRLTGDYEDAAWHQQAALSVYRELGDRLGQANTRTLLGEVRRLTGDYEGAARDIEESIRAYRDLGNPGNQAWALNHYAAAISDAGDLTRATALYCDALHLARQVQQPDDEAAALEGLGENCLRNGKLHDGTMYLHQALEIYQRLGMPTAEQVMARLTEIGAPD